MKEFFDILIKDKLLFFSVIGVSILIIVLIVSVIRLFIQIYVSEKNEEEYGEEEYSNELDSVYEMGKVRKVDLVSGADMSAERPKKERNHKSIFKDYDDMIYGYFYYEEDGESVRYEIRKDTIIIGRDAQRSDLYVPSSFAGRKHALLYNRDEKTYVLDLNSKNGTFINGERIFQEEELVNEDILKIANFEFKFVQGSKY